MFKRILSVFLALTLFLICTPFSLAAEPISSSTKIIEYNGDLFYVHDTSTRRTTVLVTTDGRIEINFSHNPDATTSIVYQFFINDLSPYLLSNGTISWNAIATLCDANQATANTLTFTITDTILTTTSLTRGGAAANDIVEAVTDIHGEPYDDLFLDDGYRNGEYIALYEELEPYVVNMMRTISWTASTSKALSLASFITGKMGLPLTTATLNFFAGVFGIADELDALIISDGELDKYVCRAIFNRYALINEDYYIYNSTEHVIEYCGIDYQDSTVPRPATIIPEPIDEYYIDGEYYYNDYDAQMDDAFNRYF